MNCSHHFQKQIHEAKNLHYTPVIKTDNLDDICFIISKRANLEVFQFLVTFYIYNTGTIFLFSFVRDSTQAILEFWFYKIQKILKLQLTARTTKPHPGSDSTIYYDVSTTAILRIILLKANNLQSFLSLQMATTAEEQILAEISYQRNRPFFFFFS